MLIARRELAEPEVFRAWMRLAMVTRDVGNEIEILLVEGTRARTLDQVVGMFVVLGERDERSYVMQHSCSAQNTGMFFLELMQFLRLIEKTQRELRHLPSVEHIDVVFLSDLLQRRGVFGVLLVSALGARVVPVMAVGHQSIA